MPLSRFLLFSFCLLTWPVQAAISTTADAAIPDAAKTDVTTMDAPLTFDSDTDLATLKVFGGQMTRQDGVLKLELEAGKGYPQLQMGAPAPLDWSDKALSLQVRNAGQQAVEVGLRVDDDAAADGWKHSWTGKWTLQAGQTQRLIFDLEDDPMQFGMRALPPVKENAGIKNLKGSGEKPLDASHITAWQLFVAQPKNPVSLEIDDIAVLPSPNRNLKGIVDEFGQYNRATWPGKVRSAAELKTRRNTEDKTLSTAPQNATLDEFGGWKNGPKLLSTGFFRTQKVNGKWWLVDPVGRLFFSSGVDAVQPANETIIAGREAMFAPIPAADTPLGKFRGEAKNVLRGPAKTGLTFDFSRANLERKYGPNWRPIWAKTTAQRLRNWGFNTVGNWSSDDLKSDSTGPRLPYVATAGIWGDHARLSDGEDYWGQMHDPFDPNFAEDAHRALAEIAAKVKNDPYCLGYFVENELSWGQGRSENPKAYFGLIYGTLNLPSSAPAKGVFLANLHQKYNSIKKLNAAWNTDLASWEALDAPFVAGDLTPEMRTDFSTFLGALADKYFTVVAAQLKSVAPHHLYLGARFSGRPPLEVARASAKNCDVVSFNIYAPQIDAKEWAFLSDLKKPTLIGEFHMGALDRGMFAPGLVSTKNQAERAQFFKNYVQSVLDNPNLVGCHWFQYADQPITGRSQDGENYNIGFVDVTDTPYTEMVAAAREVNASIYLRRSNK
ncbi:Beta-galactosidase [Abditibacterium utsteinense]|uniref:Beta-galactosidase n=1 Tax=Abditibacterium utsteinense TaxID=1960156 RepID=A0A2S8SPD1_9BACT|nr:beta-galactosidase [Abditibacterium utsteinense]PQV62650.1 Beta-galactosidase [Abditibacterium utsteinense]